jgi:glycosyltransferase involved in cell wall biosynthesis
MHHRILFLITEDWYFWSHRLPLARAARDAGFEVLVATRVDQYKGRIMDEGFKLIPILLRRRSKNIFCEIKSFLEIVKIYRAECPDVVHHVSIKPILYGSWAAKIVGIYGVVNAVSGLGYFFVAQGLRASLIKRIICLVYGSALFAKNNIVIFQNSDDRRLFVKKGIVDEQKTVLILGSGANTSLFVNHPEPGGVPVIMLASRMLWDKGISELVAAARILHRDGVTCRVVLVGSPDHENPSAIPEETLRGWHHEGVIEWWGQRDGMPNVLSQSHIVVLPTYREGLPKILIEAASCGRPIVATDVPGCREIVRHNENGFLVPLYSIKSLANALKILIHDAALRKKMGMHGREIVKNEFSEEIVVKQTMNLYKNILKKR